MDQCICVIDQNIDAENGEAPAKNEMERIVRLHDAAAIGDISVVRSLIAAKVSVNTPLETPIKREEDVHAKKFTVRHILMI